MVETVSSTCLNASPVLAKRVRGQTIASGWKCATSPDLEKEPKDAAHLASSNLTLFET